MGENIAIQKADQKEEHSRQKKKKAKKIWINVLVFVISAGVWSSAVYYGYTYAKNYIDMSIKNVQQENAINIQAVSDRINVLSNEINSLKNSINNTDSTISDSTIVQERIDKKLKTLDIQLKTLEKSLQILKEAPNGEN